MNSQNKCKEVKMTQTNLLYVLIGLACISLILGGVAVGNQIDSKDVQNAVSLELDTLEIPTTYDGVDKEKLDYIYNELSLDDRKEALSEELVLSEIATKDFKEAVFDLLSSEDIEDYKDIYKLRVKDVSVDLDDQEAEVEVELKVYYYLDGDTEETGKALLTAYFEVEDLDEDESFIDAEVEDYTLDLEKIYE